jgi:hypothetical protein
MSTSPLPADDPGPAPVVDPRWAAVTTGDRAVAEVLDVEEPLRDLLPDGGLRRGEVHGVSGSTSLLLVLLARASREGAWCAVVGCDRLGLAAAGELGVSLERLVLLPRPGPRWPEITATLLDAFDVVALSPPGPLTPVVARRLRARARQRRAVLLAFPDDPAFEARVSLGVLAQRWEGLGDGYGHLRARRMTVRARGRGVAARPRRVTLWLPAAHTPVAADRTVSAVPGISPVPVTSPAGAVSTPSAAAPAAAVAVDRAG